MELLMIPKTRELIDECSYVDGYIIGVKDLSTGYNIQMDINEIKSICDNKKIFLAINKIMFNEDLEKLEKTLKEIEKINIEGVMFYDLSVLSLTKRLGLNIKLIWNQTHMVTNYNTCNYYSSKGVYGAYLANEITLDEMIEISKKTDLKLFANIIFKPIMSHSRRNLLTNYFHSIGKNKEKDTYILSEKNNNYIIKEDNTGTTIIYGNIVNGIEPLYSMLDANFSYGIIDSTYLEQEEINDSILLISDIIKGNIDKDNAISKSKELFGEDTGFFYKKTIYKVK